MFNVNKYFKSLKKVKIVYINKFNLYLRKSFHQVSNNNAFIFNIIQGNNKNTIGIYTIQKFTYQVKNHEIINQVPIVLLERQFRSKKFSQLKTACLSLHS